MRPAGSRSGRRRRRQRDRRRGPRARDGPARSERSLGGTCRDAAGDKPGGCAGPVWKPSCRCTRAWAHDPQPGLDGGVRGLRSGDGEHRVGRTECARGGGSPLALASELLAAGMVVAGALAAQRRRPELASPRRSRSPASPGCCRSGTAPEPEQHHNVQALGYAIWSPLLAQAALRGPDEQALGRGVVSLLAAAYLATVGLLGVALASSFDPNAAGCSECPRNLLLIWSSADPSFRQVGLVASSATILALVLLIATRLARSSPARRRVTAPSSDPRDEHLFLSAVFAADAGYGAAQGSATRDPIEGWLWAAEAAALALVGLASVWERVRARRTRAALARLRDRLRWLAAGRPRGKACCRAPPESDRSGCSTVAMRERDGSTQSASLRRLPVDPTREVTPIVADGRRSPRSCIDPACLPTRAS